MKSRALTSISPKPGRRYDGGMSTYTLKLFKHPNTPAKGLPVDQFEIEAQSHEKARLKAIHIIDGAPKQAIENLSDIFVLLDEDGYEIDRWGADDA